MKIELFSKMVREKALTEPRQVLDALNKRHAQVLDDMETACESDRVKHLEGVYKKHYDRQRKAIAKAHSDAQSRVLKKRSALFDALRHGLRDEVAAFTQDDAYLPQLACRVKEALESLDFHELHESTGGDERCTVVMRPEDASRLAEIRTEVMSGSGIPEAVSIYTDDSLLGGFYVRVGQTAKYDFTLDSALDGMDVFLGCMMNTLYEITEEGCEDDAFDTFD